LQILFCRRGRKNERRNKEFKKKGWWRKEERKHK